MTKSYAAENSAAEVGIATIPWWKTIQLLLTLSLFSSILDNPTSTYTITSFSHHREGWLGSGLRIRVSLVVRDIGKNISPPRK